MRTTKIFLSAALLAFAIPSCGGSGSGTAETDPVDPDDTNDPAARGYTLTSEMRPASSLVGLVFADEVWTKVHNDMRTYGWDYTEHPNRATGDHNTETHIAVEYDETLKQSVYRLFSHCNADAVDGERGPAIGSDRMRNEMKSQTSQAWRKVNGNYDEWQILEWKMKIPEGWQPTSSFCHIHQLKGQEGSDIGSPLITISLRRDGSNGRHLEVIHTPRAGGVKVANPVDNISLDAIEGEWLQVRQEVNFKRDGYYRIRITRVADNSVVVDKEVDGIDVWRDGGCVNIRNKFGIYRSYNNGEYDGTTLPNLKDESLWLADFKVYEKNANNDAAAPVSD